MKVLDMTAMAISQGLTSRCSRLPKKGMDDVWFEPGVRDFFTTEGTESTEKN